MKLPDQCREDRGAVEIVEAALVFPVVMFVVVVLIFMGNLLYQQAKMDAIAVRGAEYLAAIYTSPVLGEGAIPTDSTKVNVKPYRYLLGDPEAEMKARKWIEGLMESTGTGFFSGMEMNGTVKVCELKNYVVYQTARVEIEYSIQFLPMKLFQGPSVFRYSTATVTAAADPAEFIRNVDMLLDYSQEFGLTDVIKSTVSAFMGN